MGVRIIDINFLLLKLKKKKYKKILILGYQNIYFNSDYLIFLKNKYFENKYSKFNVENNKGQIDCLDLFRLLSDQIDIMDVAAYEGANLIYDLSSNSDILPSEYRCKYDLIIDWGTSEHVFNLINCYHNIHGMLTYGGEFICLTPMNSMPDHGYYQISPNFYYDFFTKIYSQLSLNILKIEQIHTQNECWNLYPYERNCIDHLVNGGIDNMLYFNFIQGFKNENKHFKDDVYQYQFVEHWKGKRNPYHQINEDNVFKRNILGFEYISDLDNLQYNSHDAIIKMKSSFKISFMECI